MTSLRPQGGEGGQPRYGVARRNTWVRAHVNVPSHTMSYSYDNFGSLGSMSLLPCHNCFLQSLLPSFPARCQWQQPEIHPRSTPVALTTADPCPLPVRVLIAPIISYTVYFQNLLLNTLNVKSENSTPCTASRLVEPVSYRPTSVALCGDGPVQGNDMTSLISLLISDATIPKPQPEAGTCLPCQATTVVGMMRHYHPTPLVIGSWCQDQSNKQCSPIAKDCQQDLSTTYFTQHQAW